ncbi:SLOG family protein [Aneurinibacillus tyrosinisolvens]|uniref:SLOG family protein n=1 Tax=Aneurinibacillus tyrosinisolvens TaxID=1443435 RepID=UPI00063F5391|nr:DUF1273 domain-containing protein [Aneurinibacillus tyrosinisolvens]
MVKRLLITGYKPAELGIFDNKHAGIHYIKLAFRKRLLAFIEEGLAWCILSGQQGAELWAAEVVLELKNEYDVKLAIITPFLEQEASWKEEKQDHYRSILAQADFTTSVFNAPYEGPWMFKAKNKFLLDNTDGILVLYDDEKEGSPKFILEEANKRYEKYGYYISMISSFDLQSIVEEEQEKNYDY